MTIQTDNPGNNSDKLLSTARDHFYSLRLLEAYAIFRRFFDRIPFQPDKRHAEYIGMFARVLAELGKTRELQFYMGELERWHSRTKDPAIAYQLGIVYSYLPEPRTESARVIFEALMRDPNALHYRLKARMMLADFCDAKNDPAGSRQLIFGVDLDSIEDPTLKLMYQVWRSKILMDEGNLDESYQILTYVLSQISLQSNWYLYWWCKIILARVLFYRKQNNDGKHIISEIETFLKGTRCRSLENHLRWLKEQVPQRKPSSEKTGITRRSKET